MKSEDQKTLKSDHAKLPPRQRTSNNKEYGANIKYLCKKSTKDGAVFALEDGEDIAYHADYAVTDPLLFDYEEESDSDSDSDEDDDDTPTAEDADAEEVIYEHVGAGSNREDIQEYSRAVLLRTKPKKLEKESKMPRRTILNYAIPSISKQNTAYSKKLGSFLIQLLWKM